MPRRTAALWAVLVLALTGCASTPVSPVAAGFAPDPDTVVSRPATSSSPYSDFGRLGAGSDLVVAGERATLALPEVGVGVIPGGGGTQLLTRRVGWSRAASVIFTARRLGAAEARDLGVVDELVEAGAARDRALEIAAQIAANSPVAVRNAKKAMRLGMGTDLAAGLEIEDGCWRATAFSQDRAEGVAAFVEKRRPDWPGH